MVPFDTSTAEPGYCKNGVVEEIRRLHKLALFVRQKFRSNDGHPLAK
jgi:hypothetical protein